MKQNKILFTGFEKASESDINSSEFIINNLNKETCLLKNDYEIIEHQIEEIITLDYDYLIMLGHKPLTKRVVIEMYAKNKEELIKSDFPVQKLEKKLTQNNLAYKISKKPGNSFCNFAYYQALQLIKKNNKKTKVIFIHVPYMKNFEKINQFIALINEGE